MSTELKDDIGYAMGRSDAEEQRLQRQAMFLAPATRRLFAAAGIGPGMKILDVGSGAGDGALLAGELVGLHGRVVGVDVHPGLIETARRRAAGRANMAFVAGDIRELELDDDFDAVVGRFVLGHLPDPAAMLRRLLPHLRPGGIVAFLELDIQGVPYAAYPPTPLSEQVGRWLAQALHYTAGTDLHRIFLDAGLPAPEMLLDASVGGSPAFLAQQTVWVQETVRSLLPLLIKGGFAIEDEVGIDTLGERLYAEQEAHRSIARSNLLYGAYARRAD
jgi:2-polyprenyl-3-methyl-5-hydroxy-6-metoxy-1,4-benzoquinol methylase